MKKFFTVFFVTLGVIFFVLLLIGGYFFVTDPLNLKPIIFGTDSVEQSADVDVIVTEDKHPLLSPTQEKALETFGINPADVPSTITPEQETCFEAALGSDRVEEIKAGDSPTATEFFKAKDCL